MFLRAAFEAASVADAGASRKGRLEKAKEHLDKGLITEEEFKKIENTVLNETQLSTSVC